MWSLLLLWLASATVHASASDHEFDLDMWQSQGLFQDESRQELISELKGVPWQESKLAQVQSLLFTSGQSLDPQGKRVLNRIQLFARPRFDIWVMKQAVAGQGPGTRDFKKWNRVVIAVDKKARPYKAFYFQFGTESAGEKGVPRYKAFTAACLSCHSSGPRMIRPEQTQWTPAFGAADKALLKKWNWKIQGYREVQDHDASFEGQSMVRWNRPGDREQLKMSACLECHSHGSGVRAPLYRENFDSIRYLVKTGQMPLEGHALKAQEKQELEKWLGPGL